MLSANPISRSSQQRHRQLCICCSLSNVCLHTTRRAHNRPLWPMKEIGIGLHTRSCTSINGRLIRRYLPEHNNRARADQRPRHDYLFLSRSLRVVFLRTRRDLGGAAFLGQGISMPRGISTTPAQLGALGHDTATRTAAVYHTIHVWFTIRVLYGYATVYQHARQTVHRHRRNSIVLRV